MRSSSLLLALGFALSTAPGQWLGTTFRVPDTFGLPQGLRSLAHDPDKKVMYVAGDESDSILVVDDQTCRPVERFTVGSSSGIGALARPGDRSVLFCALCDHDQVVALDCETHRAVAQYDVGGHPAGLFYYGALSKLYVANWADNSVSAIDLNVDSVVATIQDVDARHLSQGMCYASGPRRLFCANQQDAEVVAVDPSADTVVARVKVGESLAAVCYNSANNRVYCVCRGAPGLYSIDAATCSVAVVLAESTHALSLACDSVRNRVYVPLGPALAVVDGSADTFVASVDVQTGAQWVGVDVRHNRVFVAGGSSGWQMPFGVTIIDGESMRQVRSLDGPASPCAMGPWAADGDVFCAGQDDGEVYVFDGGRNRAVGVLTNPCYVEGLSADSANGKLYCTSFSPSLVMVFDRATNGALASIPVAGVARHVLFNTENRKVYVGDESDQGRGIITVLDGIGDTVLSEIQLGTGLGALAHNPNDNVLYASVYGPDPYDIQVIDGRGDSVIGCIETDISPDALVYNAIQHKLYAISYDGIAVVDPRTNSQFKSIEVVAGFDAYDHFVLNASGSRLYYTNFYDDSVYVVDCVRDTLIGAIPVPAGNPDALCYNTTDNRLYVNRQSFGGPGTLSIIDCALDSVVEALPVGAYYPYYDRGTDAVYCLGQDGINVIDGQTSRIVRTVGPDLNPADIASAPGWSCVYAAYNVYREGPYISVIHKASGPAEMAVRAAPECQATVVRGRLDWTGTLAAVYDKSGRRVAEVHRGGNDVSRLQPGVYFIRQNAVPRGTHARKVVVTR